MEKLKWPKSFVVQQANNGQYPVRRSRPGNRHLVMVCMALYVKFSNQSRHLHSTCNGKQAYKKSLGQASNKGGTGSASEYLIVTTQMAAVWRSWVFHDPDTACIRSFQPQAKHNLPLEELMQLLLGDEEVDFEIYDLEEDSEVSLLAEFIERCSGLLATLA
ncbi:hypothetical protein M8C21_028202, partial [Ambrosia artemisiifolia]